MSKVLVIDTDKRSLAPIHPARARQLLNSGRAAIFRRFPFTLVLKESLPNQKVQPLRIKIDPGAKTTGVVIINDANREVIWAAELQHRGFAIRESLTSRRQLRRSRRHREARRREYSLRQTSRKTRYRQVRFNNRKRVDVKSAGQNPRGSEFHAKSAGESTHGREFCGWLAPSLMSRVHNIDTWVRRLCKLAPIKAISQELVRFDTQLMQNPQIQGKEYQQGELAGYETREYLLEKWNRQCAYCGVKDIPLQVEHIQPRAKGGSNRISNLTLSCEKCNTKKGVKDIKDFLKKQPEKLTKILAQAKKQLTDTAAVNSTRFKVLETLRATGLPVETGSGGLTKFNRSTQNLNKTHWIDAACVGLSTPTLNMKGVKPLFIKATGHGTRKARRIEYSIRQTLRQSCRTDKHGFPNRHCAREKIHFGFQTGDIVKAIVTTGKKIGIYSGRIATRSSGSFNISARNGLIEGISYRFCQIIHHKDGYGYAY